jgi:hypothetical protein
VEHRKSKEIDLVQHVIFLKFGHQGVEPIYCYPTELDEESIINIGTKLVSVMAGEEELISEGVTVIPFPRFKFTGLTYSFTVPDESVPEKNAAYFLTLMMKEKNPEFLFQNIDHLTEKLRDTSQVLANQDFKEKEVKIETIKLYKYFVEFSKKYFEIKDRLISESEKSIIAAAILYFHRKAGPIIYVVHPEKTLTDEQSKKLCKELEIATREGFFSRSYPDISHLSYYFEIPSDWARGKKEMVLLSFIFYRLPDKEISDALHLKSMKFVEKMEVHPEIFKGFYSPNEIDAFPDTEKAKAKEMHKLLKKWIKSLYLASLDVFQSTSLEIPSKGNQKVEVE